ncbi:hypothetical protein [Actinosynnema sp. NPDC020468]|uniref:hypothetical protein n=1 Tax=Actinosynnema sp. NPDC020468 TaxID=3154488 RepID=UPI0033C3D8BB
MTTTGDQVVAGVDGAIGAGKTTSAEVPHERPPHVYPDVPAAELRTAVPAIVLGSP